jgi:hypothetical protein
MAYKSVKSAKPAQSAVFATRMRQTLTSGHWADLVGVSPNSNAPSTRSTPTGDRLGYKNTNPACEPVLAFAMKAAYAGAGW